MSAGNKRGWLSVFLVGLLIMSGLAYLWLVNNRAVSGYKIAKMERAVNELKATKESLEARLAQLQRTGRILDAAQAMQLVKVQKVEYLVAASGELAQR